jgi:hypothetical protein
VGEYLPVLALANWPMRGYWRDDQEEERDYDPAPVFVAKMSCCSGGLPRRIVDVLICTLFR